MPVTVMFACNDPDNGNCLRRADSFELFECSLVGGRPIRVDWKPEMQPNSSQYEGDSTLIFGKMKIPCLGWSSWVGNWCWDAATVRLINAVAIWNYLAVRPDYHCEEGPCELFDLFNNHAKIDPKSAPEFLHKILYPPFEAVVK